MPKINTETILSWFLGFVVIWFGYNEVTDPIRWKVFVPPFLNAGEMAANLVIIHGIILIVSGLALIFNLHRKWAAGILALMILGIVATLIQGEGLSEIAVRDIGLLGMALALALGN